MCATTYSCMWCNIQPLCVPKRIISCIFDITKCIKSAHFRLLWPTTRITMVQPNKIDTHVHMIPPSYRQAIKDYGGDPSGWGVPTWSPAEALSALNNLGVQKAVFTVPSPGPAIAGNGPEGRALARKINEECLEIIAGQKEGRFALLACTPSWIDVEGTIREIEWAMKEKGRAGIVAMTTYEDK